MTNGYFGALPPNVAIGKAESKVGQSGWNTPLHQQPVCDISLGHLERGAGEQKMLYEPVVVLK